MLTRKWHRSQELHVEVPPNVCFLQGVPTDFYPKVGKHTKQQKKKQQNRRKSEKQG